MPITIGDDAIDKFLEFCQKHSYEQFLLVADTNTYHALGEKVFQAMQKQGWDVVRVVLEKKNLHSDDFAMMQVFKMADLKKRLYVAVGSGTITDITRFTSHRTHNLFVSFPTAASVDAYTSVNAPVTIGGMKGSIYCHAPIAIFTDLPTICASPKFLTASGFGDLISKFTSSADWKISHLIWGVDFDEEIYQHALWAAKRAREVVHEIQESKPESMRAMMEGQFASGFCMADFGNSAPASGAEHHIAHIWEMLWHWHKREGLYHGQAVGVAAIITAGWYEKLRALSKDEARRRLESVHIPTAEEQKAFIREHLTIIADEIIERNPIYIQLSEKEIFMRTKARILDNWEQIQVVARQVPPAGKFRAWLQTVEGPTTPQELGVSESEARLAIDNGHYLRERFSIAILRKLLGF